MSFPAVKPPPKNDDQEIMRFLNVVRGAAVALAASLALAPAALAGDPGTVEFTSPPDGAYLTYAPSVQWTEYGGLVAAPQCKFERTAPSATTIFAAQPCSSGALNAPGQGDQTNFPTSISWNWATSPMVASYGDGTYKVTFTAYFTSYPDQTATRTFTVDTVDPTVSASAPVGITADNTPEITYSVTDANPGTTFCAVDPDFPASLAEYTACPSSPFSMSPLSDGDHNLWIVHEDLAGNTGSVTKSFSVDATPPEITVTGLSNGQVLTTAQPTINVAAQDAGTGVAQTTCSWDGTAPVGCSDAIFANAVLTDGPHVLEVSSSDVIGNSRTLTITFSVDTTAGLKQGLIAPKSGKFKLKRGKLKRGKYGASVTSTFALPAGGNAKSCSGTAYLRLTLKKRIVASAKVRWKASGASCVATGAPKVPAKFRGKKLTLTLDYKNGPIKAFRISGSAKL